MKSTAEASKNLCGTRKDSKNESISHRLNRNILGFNHSILSRQKKIEILLWLLLESMYEIIAKACLNVKTLSKTFHSLKIGSKM